MRVVVSLVVCCLAHLFSPNKMSPAAVHSAEVPDAPGDVCLSWQVRIPAEWIAGRGLSASIFSEAPICRVDGPVSCTWISHALMSKCVQQTIWWQEWSPGDLKSMYTYSNAW